MIPTQEDQRGRGDLTTLAGQQAHYAGVRARLRYRPAPSAPRPLPMVLMIQPKPIEPEPEVVPFGAPLNMRTAPNWRFLVAFTALRHGLMVEDILSPARPRSFVQARYEAMCLTYEHTQASFPQVGRLFKRDHSTVIYGMQKLGRTKKLVDRFIIHSGGNPKARMRRGERLLKSKLNWEARA